MSYILEAITYNIGYNRALKAIRVRMALMDMMVNQEKVVATDQKEMMVTLVMLVQGVQKDNVLIALDLLELRVKWEIREEKYAIYFALHFYTYVTCLIQGIKGKRGQRGPIGYKGEKVRTTVTIHQSYWLFTSAAFILCV